MQCSGFYHDDIIYNKYELIDLFVINIKNIVENIVVNVDDELNKTYNKIHHVEYKTILWNFSGMINMNNTYKYHEFIKKMNKLNNDEIKEYYEFLRNSNNNYYNKIQLKFLIDYIIKNEIEI